MWSSPRSRARFNRACVRRALASLSTTALIFLQRGGANPAGKPPTSMAWCRASRAADSASRIPPLSFDGDKRGRMRQFHEAVVSCIPQKVCPQLSWHDFSVRTRFEKSKSVPVIDWSEDLTTGGERESASFDASCRSRHVTRSWCCRSYKNSELFQLASLSLPTHVAELVADPSNLARLQLSTLRLQLCLPTSHPNTVD